MKSVAFFRSFARWTGAAMIVALAVAMLVSTKRGFFWTSADGRRQISLAAGGVVWGWRPEGWQRSADRFVPEAGWTTGEYGGEGPLRLLWWPHRTGNKCWLWVEVPLWMPFVALAIPTGWSWLHWLRRRERHA